MKGRLRCPRKDGGPRARFYVFLAVLALAIWLIVTLIVRSSGGTVVAGSLVFEEPFSAVVIRDEQVVTAGDLRQDHLLCRRGRARHQRRQDCRGV